MVRLILIFLFLCTIRTLQNNTFPEQDFPTPLESTDSAALEVFINDTLTRLGLDRSATAREVYQALGIPVSPFPITPDGRGGSFYDQIDRALPGTTPQYGHGINARNDASYFVRQHEIG